MVQGCCFGQSVIRYNSLSYFRQASHSWGWTQGGSSIARHGHVQNMPWIVTISMRCSCPLLYVYTCTSIGQLTSLSCIDVGCKGDAVQMDGCSVVGGCTCVECTTSVGMGTGKGRVGTVYWN